MERGERYLARAHQVQIVFGEVVNLGRVSPQKSGALHRLGLHQYRRDHRDETRLNRLGDGEVDQCELKKRTDAGEKVEAGTADFRSSFSVDCSEEVAELQMITNRERKRRWCTDFFEYHEVGFAPGWNAGFDDVGELHV